MARWGSDVIGFAVGVAIGTGTLQLLSSSVSVVPTLEAYFAPVVRIADVTDIYRQAHNAAFTTGRACFTLQIEKLRAATPLPYGFKIKATSGYGGWQPVQAYLANADNTRAKDQGYGTPHAAGEKWPRRYCFEFPGTIADADTVIVEGMAHHSRHPFWDTDTPVPAFTIGAAGS